MKAAEGYLFEYTNSPLEQCDYSTHKAAIAWPELLSAGSRLCSFQA